MHGDFPLSCPVCAGDLCAHEKTYRCPAGHSYDVAREGYLNLLLSHLRKSNQAGDTPDMISARQAFLAAGHYRPLADKLGKMARASDPSTILDAGCGTGYFLNAVAEALPHATGCGMDISKSGIRAAAKDFPGLQWVVANVMRSLPVRNASVDLILNLMAPRHVSEFARILKPGGRIIMGIPGPGHLQELRALLLEREEEVDKAERAETSCAPEFKLLRVESVTFTLSLEAAGIRQLITMTPLIWKAPRDAIQRAENLETLTVTASFQLLEFG